MNAWISVSESLPDKECLAFYKNMDGIGRVVRAGCLKRFEVEQSPDEDNQEYCAESDTYYVPEGWYELIDNWECYFSIKIKEGVVTHWMPLPPAPYCHEIK